MSGTAKPAKGAGRGPDLNVVDSPPAQHAPVTGSSDVAAPKPAPPARDNAATPRDTTADLWADLHPARIWPD